LSAQLCPEFSVRAPVGRHARANDANVHFRDSLSERKAPRREVLQIKFLTVSGARKLEIEMKRRIKVKEQG
jgi:hypothetical protein